MSRRASRPDPSPAPDAAVEAAERLLADLRAELSRADTKASVLVAALSLTGGLVGGLLTGQGWYPGRLRPPAAVLWWGGIAAFTLVLCALLLAVLPRYRRSAWAPGRPLCYFGDIQRAADRGLLEAALADTARAPARRLQHTLSEISRIAARKHHWIRIALVAYGVGTVLLPSSLLIA